MSFLLGDAVGQNTYLDSMLNVLADQKMDSSRANLLYNIAWEYREADKETAIMYMEKGIALSTEVEYDKGLIAGLKDLGGLMIIYGMYSEADSALNSALDLAESVGNGHYISKTLSNMAWLHEKMGNYELAEECYAKALSTPNSNLKGSDIMASYNFMGAINHRQGENDKAIVHYLNALEISDSLGNAMTSSVCMNNIGALFYRVGNMEKALDYFEKSLEIKREAGDQFGIASSLNNIASVLLENTDTLKALDYFKQALKIREEIGDLHGIAASLNNIGGVYRQLNRNEEAIALYEKSVALKEQIGDKAGLTVTLNNIAIAYREMELFPQALDHALRSLVMAREIGSYDDAKIGLETTAQIYGLMGDYEKAYDHHRDYVSIKDSLFNLEKSTQIEELERKYNTDRQEKELKIQRAENAQKDAELKEQDLRTKAIIVIFLLLSLVSALLFVFYRVRRRAELKRSIQEKNLLLKEMELLRATLNMDLNKPAERQKVNINRQDINRNLVTPLTEREMEVLGLICDGKTNKAIGEDLYVSVNTIKTHALSIYEKLDVNNRTQALKKVGKLHLAVGL
jgi:ATP/maltotriose-dependent transcriptional regulator MalT